MFMFVFRFLKTLVELIAAVSAMATKASRIRSRPAILVEVCLFVREFECMCVENACFSLPGSILLRFLEKMKSNL